MGQDEEEIFSRKDRRRCYKFATTSWVWFNRMNQILEGTAKADGTPNGLDQSYAHVGYFQAPNIEEDLPYDDIGPSKGESAPPQSPPSTILAFGTFADTSNMGT
jgi:hypothetical protein